MNPAADGATPRADGIDDSSGRVRCYLCGEFRPKDQTDLNPYRVVSSQRGGTVQGVIRYVRMCSIGHGCKERERYE